MKFVLAYALMGLAGIVVGSIITWSIMIKDVERVKKDHEEARKILLHELQKPLPRCTPEFQWIINQKSQS